jgi:hypothetical protein
MRGVLPKLGRLSILSTIAGSCFACSVLSHEAVVDALWDVKLKQVLLSRYPGASEADLKTAHGYAYGGSIIQDLGYYPHGSKAFSDLTHYVRTGDFIVSLVSEAGDLNELAFALGALSHYASDLDVHRSATNPGEAILYPKLQRKFGPIITYENDPATHLKTEFGFDVLEVAKGNFASETYHSFIGFYVSGPLIGRAFHHTYGLELSDLFSDFDRAVGSYRQAVSRTIPKATRIAWAERASEIRRANPGVSRSKFIYVMNRSSYEREWGREYDRPTAREHVLAILLRLIPPIGPLRVLRFKMPTAPVEALFVQSFDKAVKQFSAQLESARTRTLQLEDWNYDLGQPAKPGVYGLQDKACAYWLGKLAEGQYRGVTPAIRETLLKYYQDQDVAFETKKNPREWNRLVKQLKDLKSQDLQASR